jgi:hypothetical protein
MDHEPHTRQHWNSHAALQVQREGLRERIGAQHDVAHRHRPLETLCSAMRRMLRPCTIAA